MPFIGFLTDKSDSINQVDSECEYIHLYKKKILLPNMFNCQKDDSKIQT